jgi:4-alpha-glucanotransferase
LLAAFLDEPLEISPYRPASRLFWNELYIDVEAVPELHKCQQCTQLIESPEFQASKDTLRMSERVDYREAMRLKRRVLELLAANFFANDTDLQRMKKFVRKNPHVEDYARFRAAHERQRKSWQDWPVGLKDGRFEQGDYDPSVMNYHLFVQWVANAQLAQLRDESNTLDCYLYLDLPTGVHPEGFDTWRYQQEYVEGASVGAPPDVVFPKGQDWGLPPLHPELGRQNGHELFRKVMQNNCQYAGRLRIDHILGFHRLYCIPRGASATQGAFVRYPAEELYAIAIVESHRWGCELVGENLGTVPSGVDRRMKAHDIAGMWVAPYELEPGRRTMLKAPTHHDVAMLNTHDMPPLAAWWKGLDIDERLDLGLIDGQTVDQECEQRSIAIQHLKKWLHTDGELTKEDEVIEDEPPVSELLRRIASTSARLLLINLEDLWFETRSQNIPGLSTELTNWQRKARFRLEEFRNMSQITNLLREVHALRTEQKQLT